MSRNHSYFIEQHLMHHGIDLITYFNLSNHVPIITNVVCDRNDDLKYSLRMLSLTSVMLAAVPQTIIQLALVISLRGFSNASLLSLTTSVIAVLFGVLKRLVTYLMRKAERKQSMKYVHPMSAVAEGKSVGTIKFGARHNSRGETVELAWSPNPTNNKMLTSPQPTTIVQSPLAGITTMFPSSPANGGDTVAISGPLSPVDMKQKLVGDSTAGFGSLPSDALVSSSSPIAAPTREPHHTINNGSVMNKNTHPSVSDSESSVSIPAAALHDEPRDNDGHTNVPNERKEGEPLPSSGNGSAVAIAISPLPSSEGGNNNNNG
jgi:hypothetical protein